ncbi:hypothetical protein [Spiroplasma endosymbiont of Polydrusus pterygomalis]|uniref:hypothetical protein n=1 Tax=Spiroplasma endosymbiont of Polydrusus pterygomalis TaxID=3139327 RepID=UPI003CCB0641
MSLNQIKTTRKQKIKKKDKTHPLRERRKCFGELLQADASEHHWLGQNGPKWFLHGAIDDTTNTVVGLYFACQETLQGYYNVLHQILRNYGIPMTFYTDKRTIFTYQKNSDKNEEKDTFTQLSRCCDELGVEIITTSIPPSKGTNWTFMRRSTRSLEKWINSRRSNHYWRSKYILKRIYNQIQ